MIRGDLEIVLGGHRTAIENHEVLGWVPAGPFRFDHQGLGTEALDDQVTFELDQLTIIENSGTGG